jgi:hypothetical protein
LPPRSPVASIFSVCQATHFKVSSCPWRIFKAGTSGRRGSEMMEVLSALQVASRSSDGDQRTSNTPFSCGLITVRGGSGSQSLRADTSRMCTVPCSVATAKCEAEPHFEAMEIISTRCQHNRREFTIAEMACIRRRDAIVVVGVNSEPIRFM